MQLTPAFFQALVDQPFRLPACDDLQLTLTSVTETRWSTAAHPSFSLLFSGPPQPSLPQQTYAMSADGITLDMFIVPVARNATGMQYQAVFN